MDPDPHSFPSWIRIQEGNLLENEHKNAGKFVIIVNFIKIVRLCSVRIDKGGPGQYYSKANLDQLHVFLKILLSNLFFNFRKHFIRKFFLGSKEHYQ